MLCRAKQSLSLQVYFERADLAWSLFYLDYWGKSVFGRITLLANGVLWGTSEHTQRAYLHLVNFYYTLPRYCGVYCIICYESHELTFFNVRFAPAI